MRKTLTLCLVALSASVLAAARLLLFAFRYDGRLMHYNGTWEEPTVLLLSCLILAAFAVLAYGNRHFGEASRPSVLPRIGLAPALSGLAFSVLLFASLRTVLVAETKAVLTVAALAVAGASISFIILSMPTRESFPLFLFPTLAPILYAAYRYFDLSVPMNSPEKLFEELAAMLVSLAFLAKCRNIASKKAPRFAFTVTAIAAVFCFAEGFPRLVRAALNGNVFGIVAAVYFISMSVYLAFALYNGIKDDSMSITETEKAA